LGERKGVTCDLAAGAAHRNTTEHHAGLLNA
jgi:hypothetical protein